MRNFLITLAAALGMVLVLEGLAYFSAPAAVKEVGRWVMRRSDAALRLIGLFMVASGLIVVFLVLRLGGLS